MLSLPLVTLAVCLVHSTAALPTDQSNSILSGANRFSQSLYKHLHQNHNRNLVVSPLSAYTALLMASFGASGETLIAFRSQLPAAIDDLALFSEAWSHLNINEHHVVLNIANKIYTFNITPKPTFEAVTSSVFKSKIENLDRKYKQKAVETMNDWVDQQTNHKIQKIIDIDDIDESTAMVILNTIYFNGKWWDPFNTKFNVNETFYVDEYTNKTVEMMYLNQPFFFGKVDDLEADFIELPYWDNKATMTIIIPREGVPLSEIEENLHLLTREKLQKAGDFKSVHFYLPKFKIESTIDLKKPLEKMGLGIIFKNEADFKGIADEIIKVSKVSQKVVIEVNEKGTEAGVSTALNFSDKSWTNLEMKVNRPSLAIIRISDIDVFIVRLVDPTVA